MRDVPPSVLVDKYNLPDLIHTRFKKDTGQASHFQLGEIEKSEIYLCFLHVQMCLICFD